jgi:hypothetical protein
MTLADAYAEDYRHVDFVEDVSYTSPDGVTTVSGKARRKTPRRKEDAGTVALAVEEVLWEVWPKSFAAGTGVDVKCGGTITDAANAAWSIVNLDTDSAGSIAVRHQCLCKKKA